MFKTLNSNKIDSTLSLLEKNKSTGYVDILTTSLDNISSKIIVMCNYDYSIIENDEIDAKHELLQYIHFNTFIPKNDDTLNSIKSTLTASTNVYKNNALINMQLNEIIKSDASNLYDIIELNKIYPLMIIPNSLNNLSAVVNPTALEDIYGYTFRALEFSSIVNFSKEIPDPDIKIYIDEFNIANSAFILKPIKLRNHDIMTQND